MEAVRKVDPNMVIKKKNGKEAEVQEGWKGHILPFDLVQKSLLKSDLDALHSKEEELSEIPGEYEALLESLSEEDKETISEALNDTNDAFVIKNIKAVIKELKEDPSSNDELILLLQNVEKLSAKEKKLKSDIRSGEEALHVKTKETIENQSEAEVHQLLHEKWVSPIVSGTLKLADDLLDGFTKNIQELSVKYSVTMSDLEKEIQSTEASLSAMLSDLTGSESDIAGIRELQKLLGGVS